MLTVLEIQSKAGIFMKVTKENYENNNINSI